MTGSAISTPPSDAGSTTRSSGEGVPVHGLGPNALTIEDEPDGFDPVALLIAGTVYLQQGESQIFLGLAQSARLAAALATTPSPDASPDSREAIPAGMKPWAGGNASPPADWDGGPVQYRTGAVDVAVDDWSRAGLGTDIVAYTPRRPSSSPAIVKEAGEVERLREALEQADFQAFLALESGLNNGGAVAWRDGLSRVQEVLRAALSASNAAQVSK